MAIITERAYRPIVDEGDPDDYRPNSNIAMVLDPSRPDGQYVNGVMVLFERMAPGDCIPLHVHTIEELIIIDEGSAEVTLGQERRTVGAGAVVFIPAGVPHGTRNLGAAVLRLHAVFPSHELPIQYLERNPAPGTEGNAPQPPITYDMRAWVERKFAEMIHPA
ncbi:MAG: cupin domain-containing protein [Caldilinea sp. CFX5]|nr:cupin domain-containing protein [Caldilinea sp. CFX5]